MTAVYDQIGKGYVGARVPDSRIAALLHRRLRNAARLLNIGAGTGSYEPRDQSVIAVEPSAVMLAQRPPGSHPAVQAVAERLPFADDSFDAAMAVLSIHHWSDWRAGIREALRVARGRLALLTWTGFPTPFWLLDYFPEIAELDRHIFPTVSELEAEMGPLRIDTVDIPYDCRDGFLCAYWRRPQAYLEFSVRNSISSFAKIRRQGERLTRLRADLENGQWDERYGHLHGFQSMDYGYRIVSCGLDSAVSHT